MSRVATYFVILLLVAEAIAWAAGNFLQAKWLMYKDPQPGRRPIALNTYLAIRDPFLGWPMPQEFGSTYAPDGSRWCKGPALPPNSDWLASLYGDSFTADWVGGDTDHWGCRMQRELAATVRNYGVGGYGTDQAFLRYWNNPHDRARVVILGHMSENISRNLTRYRDLETRSQDWAFKPRFVLDRGVELSFVPIPSLNESEYRRFLGLDSPQFVLAHENFAPNGPAGATRHEPPFLVSQLRNLGNWEVRARIRGLPPYGPLYDAQHPLGGLQLTVAIMLAFEREAVRRDQKAVLVIFPGLADLRHFRKSGEWIYQNLLDSLGRAGAKPFNFGEALVRHLGARPIELAFADHHYTQEISHLVADSVTAELAARGWIGHQASQTEQSSQPRVTR
jgi:hypothetical protein